MGTLEAGQDAVEIGLFFFKAGALPELVNVREFIGNSLGIH